MYLFGSKHFPMSCSFQTNWVTVLLYNLVLRLAGIIDEKKDFIHEINFRAFRNRTLIVFFHVIISDFRVDFQVELKQDICKAFANDMSIVVIPKAHFGCQFMLVKETLNFVLFFLLRSDNNILKRLLISLLCS